MTIELADEQTGVDVNPSDNGKEETEAKEPEKPKEEKSPYHDLEDEKWGGEDDDVIDDDKEKDDVKKEDREDEKEEPLFSDPILNRADELGIKQSQIDKFATEEELEFFLLKIESKLPKPEAKAVEKAPEEKNPLDELKDLDADEYGKEIAERDKTLRGIIDTLYKQNLDIKKLVGEIDGDRKNRQAYDLDSEIDTGISALPKEFTGMIDKKNREELIDTMEVLDALDNKKDRKTDSIKNLVLRATKILQPETTEKKAESNLRKKLNSREKQITTKPSHRSSTAADPSEKAAQSLREKFPDRFGGKAAKVDDGF